MPASRWLPLLLGLLLPAAAGAEETHWHEPLWLQPPGADAPFPVLLTLPPGWQPGDAAVVLLPDPDRPDALRHRLAAALLAAEAAVVVLDPLAAWAELPALPAVPALTAAERPAALRDALQRLRAETGAGLLVALGLGAAGEVALRAAADPAAPSLAAPGLAAAVALGGAPRFLAGAPPPAAEQWPLRAPVLCAVVAEATGDAATARDCRAALLH